MNHVNYCLQTILILVRADEDLHMFAEKHVVLDLLGFVTRTVAILRKEHNAIGKSRNDKLIISCTLPDIVVAVDCLLLQYIPRLGRGCRPG